MNDEWAEVTLGDLLTLEYGKALPEKDRDGVGFPVLGSAGVVGRHSTALVQGPGIVVGRKGTAGSVVWVEEDFSPIDTTYWVRLKDSRLSLDFAYLLLSSLDLPGICAQTGVPGLNRDRAYALSASIPTLPIQRRIVDVLTHLDAHIANLRTECDCFKELEVAALASLFSEEAFAAGTSCLSDSASVYDCLHKTAPPATVAEDVYGYSVGTREIKDGLILTGGAKPVTESIWIQWSQKVQVSPGDIIMAREAPVGPVALVPEDASPLCLGQRTVLIRANGGLDPCYLSGLLRSPATQHWMQGESAGLTVAHLNVADIKRIPMPSLPPIDRQRAIGEVVADLLSSRVKREEELSALGSLRSALLEGLLSGTVTVESVYDGILEVA